MSLTLFCFTTILIFNSCNKKAQSPVPTPTPAKYYATFKVDGRQTEFRSDLLQTGHDIFGGKKQVGGYINDGAVLGARNLGITIYNRNDSIGEQLFQSFAGKTFYFDDPDYYVELNYQRTNPVTGQYDSYNYEKDDHKYSIAITSINNLGQSPDKDLNGKYYNEYEVTGTCSGFLYSAGYTDSVEITEGAFFFRWTKVLP